MKDSDIIKVLECCADTSRGCEDCPFLQVECIVDTENLLMKSALDLINRKEEIIKAQADKIFLLEAVLKDKTAAINILNRECNK